MDGTDFRIEEPVPFDRKWYSHKFNGPGLRYEVAVSIQCADIVWVNGPYPCGEWPDLRIAQNAIIYEVDEGEFLLADGGYNDGSNYMETPNGLNNEDQRQKALVRARHENLNRCFKEFHSLSHRFRHPLHKHGLVAHSVTRIVQVKIREGEIIPFYVEYYDG